MSSGKTRSHLLAALKCDGRSLDEWRESATSLTREHYRVAAETSALPELGKAIDAALDGDDPALERAIATLKLTSQNRA